MKRTRVIVGTCGFCGHMVMGETGNEDGFSRLACNRCGARPVPLAMLERRSAERRAVDEALARPARRR